MASVKWLVRLDALAAPYDGYFQRRRYVYDDAGGVRPVSRMRVKSAIVAPADGARVPCGRVAVCGWAWSGDGAIDAVEVGRRGRRARGRRRASRPSRRRTPGRGGRPRCGSTRPGGTCCAAAPRDASGAVQPDLPPWNRLGYGNNAVRAVVVDAVG
jgi:hypothetical protein